MRKYLGLFLILFVALAACEKKGTLEKAGEKIDEGIEKAGDKVDDGLDKAGDKVKDATN